MYTNNFVVQHDLLYCLRGKHANGVFRCKVILQHQHFCSLLACLFLENVWSFDHWCLFLFYHVRLYYTDSNIFLDVINYFGEQQVFMTNRNNCKNHQNKSQDVFILALFYPSKTSCIQVEWTDGTFLSNYHNLEMLSLEQLFNSEVLFKVILSAS